MIYADEKQNAVFLRRSMDEEKITGANLRGPAGTDNKFKVLKPTVKCRQAIRGRGECYHFTPPIRNRA